MIYSELMKIRDKREPITIVTSSGVFENLILVSLSLATKTGNEVEFTAAFRQIVAIS